jgi:hypothetical protein
LREAAELADQKSLDATAARELSRVFALLATAARTDATLPVPERDRRADQHAARAVALLDKARAGGAFNEAGRRALLKTDPDWDALRQRDDFRKLLNAVDGQPAAKP